MRKALGVAVLLAVAAAVAVYAARFRRDGTREPVAPAAQEAHRSPFDVRPRGDPMAAARRAQRVPGRTHLR